MSAKHRLHPAQGGRTYGRVAGTLTVVDVVSADGAGSGPQQNVVAADGAEGRATFAVAGVNFGDRLSGRPGSAAAEAFEQVGVIAHGEVIAAET